MRIGERVQVFSTFNATWVAGFQLVGIAQDNHGHAAFVVQRTSDGMVLPTRFPLDEVRVDEHPAGQGRRRRG
jgi:hypothetical protein